MAKSIKSKKEDPVGGNSGQVTPKLKFWISLAKWFIVSVAFVVATKVIDTGFRERAADLTELKFYDRYVTELIVLNPNPVNRIMLAEYLICVSPSEKVRERWQVYYDSIYPEYLAYVEPILVEIKRLDARHASLARLDKLTNSESAELKRIAEKRSVYQQLLDPPFQLPEDEYLH